MQTRWILGALALGGGAWLLGCGGDDILYATDSGGVPSHGDGAVHMDSTTGDSMPQPETGPEAAADAPADRVAEAADAGDAALPERLLLSDNGSSTSELVVVDVPSRTVAGRLSYPGFIGTTDAKGAFPFLLEQSADVVAQLDPALPWQIDRSWNVSLSDQVDGGSTYSDPDAVLVSAANKAYVLRYTRNEIAVLDLTSGADGGVPSATIDLSSLVQPGDSDGTLEMTGGAYVASRHLLYVVLGNIDTNLVSPSGFVLLCASTVSSLIAIDVTTGQLASLGGSAPGNGIALNGFSPIFGGVVYDPVADRLVIVSSGCNQPPSSDAGADAGPGPLVKRLVEEVKFGATGQPAVLLDLTSQGFPSQFSFIDATHAVLGFDFYGPETHLWDPTSTSLGPLLPNAPDFFVYDGAGNLLGTRTDATSDGGSALDVVAVHIADGMTSTLLSNPFSLVGGFVSGADLWPPH